MVNCWRWTLSLISMTLCFNLTGLFVCSFSQHFHQSTFSSECETFGTMIFKRSLKRFSAHIYRTRQGKSTLKQNLYFAILMISWQQVSIYYHSKKYVACVYGSFFQLHTASFEYIQEFLILISNSLTALPTHPKMSHSHTQS